MPLWVWIVGGLVGVAVVWWFGVERQPKHRMIDAAGKGDVEAVGRFLDGGMDVNVKGLGGLTALGVAVDYKQLEMVRYLLGRGADPNLKSGATLPLGDAVDGELVEVVRVLLEGGADPNASALFGATPLTDAADEGRLEVLRLLLEHGGDADGVADGKTILGHAILTAALQQSAKDAEKRGRTLEAMRMLLAHGANPNRRTSDGFPLVLMAMSQPDVLRILADAGAILDVEQDGVPMQEVLEGILAEHAKQA